MQCFSRIVTGATTHFLQVRLGRHLSPFCPCIQTHIPHPQAHAAESRNELVQSGLPILLPLLRTSRDEDTVACILETLLDVLSDGPAQDGPVASDSAPASYDPTPAARQIVSEPATIGAVLEALGVETMWTRLLAIQLLGALVRLQPDATNAAVLACSAGMGRLVDILDDDREEIRNEALLLLGHVTEANAEIRSLVAFQEGFDKLLRIAQLALCADDGAASEGGAGGTPGGFRFDGLVTATDCLAIIGNVLRGSALTQKLFAQGPTLRRLPLVLLAPLVQAAHYASRVEPGAPPLPRQLSDQARAMSGLAMEILQELTGVQPSASGGDGAASAGASRSPLEVCEELAQRVSPSSSSSASGVSPAQAAATQIALGEAPGLLEALAALAFSQDGLLDPPARVSALRVLASMSVDCPRAQARLLTVLVRDPWTAAPVAPQPYGDGATARPLELALTCAANAAMDAPDASERDAAEVLLHAAHRGPSHDARVAFVSHAVAPPPVPVAPYGLTDLSALESPAVLNDPAFYRSEASDELTTPTPPGRVALPALGFIATQAAQLAASLSSSSSSSGAPVLPQPESLENLGRMAAVTATVLGGGGSASSNSLAQEIALQITFDRLGVVPASGAPHESLLSGLAFDLLALQQAALRVPSGGSSAGAGGVKGPVELPLVAAAQLPLLRLLVAWLGTCGKAAQAFLSQPANLAIFDTLGADAPSAGSNTPAAVISRGASALVLCACFSALASGGSSEGASPDKQGKSGRGQADKQQQQQSLITRKSLLSMIQGRVGVSRLSACAQALLDLPLVAQASRGKPRPVAVPDLPGSAPVVLVDTPLALALQAVVAAHARAMVEAYGGSNSDSSASSSAGGNGADGTGSGSGSGGSGRRDDGVLPSAALEHYKELIRMQDGQLKALTSEREALARELAAARGGSTPASGAGRPAGVDDDAAATIASLQAQLAQASAAAEAAAAAHAAELSRVSSESHSLSLAYN